MSTLYEDVGGEAAMLRLAQAWHARALQDPVVSHAFSHGYRSDHTERLAAYLVESIGGPPRYGALEDGTESHVARLHGGNGPHEEMDRRSLVCFDGAIRDIGLDPEAGPGERLHALWADGLRRFAAYADDAGRVPEGLEIPRFDRSPVSTAEPAPGSAVGGQRSPARAVSPSSAASGAAEPAEVTASSSVSVSWRSRRWARNE